MGGGDGDGLGGAQGRGTPVCATSCESSGCARSCDPRGVRGRATPGFTDVDPPIRWITSINRMVARRDRQRAPREPRNLEVVSGAMPLPEPSPERTALITGASAGIG